MTSKSNISYAFVFTITLILVHMWFGVVTYEANDDLWMIALVKGLFGLAPGYDGIYISPLLGILMFFSYKFMPSWQWYSMFLYVGTAVSCFSASYAVLRSAGGICGKVAGLLGIGFFVSLVAMKINFSAVGLLLWVTGCAVLLSAARKEYSWGTIDWLAAGQLAVAYLLRPDIAPILLTFAIPLLLILLLSGTRQVASRILLPLLVVVVLGVFCSVIVRGGETYSRYFNYIKARGIFHNTLRGSMTANTGPASFAVGWNYDDFNVMKNWWIYDGDIFSFEKIEKFMDVNAASRNLFSFDMFKNNFNAKKIAVVLIIAWGVAWIIGYNKEKNWYWWFLLLVIMCLPVFYLMGVRFPPRISVPSLFMLFLYGAVLTGRNYNNTQFVSIVTEISKLAIVVALGVCLVPELQGRVASAEATSINKQYLDRSLLEVIRVNGPDSIIVDVNPASLPLTSSPFEENDPVLKIPVLGPGWLIETPAYLEQVQRAGLGGQKAVVPAMIDNPRVVLRFWDSPWLSFSSYVKGTFLRHLRQNYNVPESGRTIDVNVVKDFRQNGAGVVYFRLVTIPL